MISTQIWTFFFYLTCFVITRGRDAETHPLHNTIWMIEYIVLRGGIKGKINDLGDQTNKRLVHKSYLHGPDWYLAIDYIVSYWSKLAIKNLVLSQFLSLFFKILISKWTALTGEWLMPWITISLQCEWMSVCM